MPTVTRLPRIRYEREVAQIRKARAQSAVGITPLELQHRTISNDFGYPGEGFEEEDFPYEAETWYLAKYFGFGSRQYDAETDSYVFVEGYLPEFKVDKSGRVYESDAEGRRYSSAKSALQQIDEALGKHSDTLSDDAREHIRNHLRDYIIESYYEMKEKARQQRRPSDENN